VNRLLQASRLFFGVGFSDYNTGFCRAGHYGYMRMNVFNPIRPWLWWMPDRIRSMSLAVCFFTTWLLLVTPACPGQRVYRIGYSPGAGIHEVARQRVKDVYERAGLAVEFVPLPHKRSLAQANEGTLDGEVGRIAGIEKDYPNLMRVNVRVLTLTGVAYVMESWGISRYDDLLLDKVRLGTILGVVWSKKKIGNRHCVFVNDYKTLFNMLLARRIDMALASSISAEAVFKSGLVDSGKIRKLDPPIHIAPLYHYVNVKNAGLVPLLEKTLRQLHAEQYWQDVAKPMPCD